MKKKTRLSVLEEKKKTELDESYNQSVLHKGP